MLSFLFFKTPNIPSPEPKNLLVACGPSAGATGTV